MSPDTTLDQSTHPLAALRRFARPRRSVEQCELCSVELGPDHEHLVEPATRKLLCACNACAILFGNKEAANFRRLPRRIRLLNQFRITDEQWDSLMIPIGLSFFFHSSPAGRVVAVYPSPGGPMESLLELTAWRDLARDNPELQTLEPDTEALLVNRIGAARAYYLVPIDECYKLVGLIRMHWHGISGGKAVWEQIDQFFAALQARAASSRRRGHA